MSTAETFLNFSYGSNMLTRRLSERVPSAQLVTVAVLSGYEMHWHKVSKDGSGKCDIVQNNEVQSKVIGVIYKIHRSEKPLLDKAEGLGNGYEEKLVFLETEIGQLQAFTYYATNIDPLAKPYTWYKDLVVAGAEQHSLPEEYILQLKSVACKTDSDNNRTKKNLANLESD